EAHRKAKPALKGFLGGSLIKTGDQTYCMVGEWRSFQNIVNARPQMIEILDGMRDMLEDLGSGLGVTDPVSGQVVARMAAPKTTKKKRTSGGGKAKAKAKRKPAKRAAGKRR